MTYQHHPRHRPYIVRVEDLQAQAGEGAEATHADVALPEARHRRRQAVRPAQVGGAFPLPEKLIGD